MKRLCTFLMLFMALTFTAFAGTDGFVGTKSTYYFNKSYDVDYTDYSPCVAGTKYYFAVSYDKGATWARFSDTKEWTTIDLGKKAHASMPITCISDSAEIGLFTNPNSDNNFGLYDYFYADFKCADKGTITDIPSVIYNGGTYKFKVNLNVEQLPEALVIQKSIDGTNWTYFDTYKSNTENGIYKFVNDGRINKHTYFRLVYQVPSECVLAQTDIIPFMMRETYLEFTTTIDGTLNMGKELYISWIKSSNFEFTMFKVFLGDTLLIPNTKIIGVNEYWLVLNNPGVYKIVIVVEDANFRIEKQLIFKVGDPCDLLAIENKELKDSIAKLNKALTDWKAEAEARLKTINSLKERITELEKQGKDTITIVCYDLKDPETKVCDNPITDELVLMKDNILSVKVNADPGVQCMVWLFDSLGKNLCTWVTELPNTSLSVKGSLTKGMYFVWVKKGNDYKVYKVINL